MVFLVLVCPLRRRKCWSCPDLRACLPLPYDRQHVWCACSLEGQLHSMLMYEDAAAVGTLLHWARASQRVYDRSHLRPHACDCRHSRLWVAARPLMRQQMDTAGVRVWGSCFCHQPTASSRKIAWQSSRSVNACLLLLPQQMLCSM